MPRWFWWILAGPATVWIQPKSDRADVFRAKWNRTYFIEIPEAGAVVETSYGTYNWSGANPATFQVSPGDVVDYQAFWWPVRKGKISFCGRR